MHPLAWWAWALGLAVATTRTTSMLVVWVVLAAATLVALACRAATPWGRAFGGYLVLGAVIVVVRLAFHVLVGLKPPGTVLVALPSVALPDWAAGVALLGPVTAEGLRVAFDGGLRLAALVVCVGAANALANPKRALRSLPASLHHLGTAVVIAVSAAPQLVSSAAGVRRARRLRGLEGRGPGTVLATATPVLADALERSLALAASMDVRGYARTLPGSPDGRVGGLVALALLAAGVGGYGLLDGTSPAWLGVPVLVVGAGAAAGATVLAGRQVTRTRYRPDPWGPAQTAVAASGAAATALLLWSTTGQSAAVSGALLAAGAAVAVAPALVARTVSR